MRRQVGLAAFEVPQHATHMRAFEPAAEQPPGLHHLMARVVDGRGGVINAADIRDLVAVSRHSRKHFRNRDSRRPASRSLERPADFGGGVGLHVPGVELAGSAQVEDHDAVDVLVCRQRPRRLRARPIRPFPGRPPQATRLAESRGGSIRRRYEPFRDHAVPTSSVLLETVRLHRALHVYIGAARSSI